MAHIHIILNIPKNDKKIKLKNSQFKKKLKLTSFLAADILGGRAWRQFYLKIYILLL